jgi:hypothetical protein
MHSNTERGRASCTTQHTRRGDGQGSTRRGVQHTSTVQYRFVGGDRSRRTPCSTAPYLFTLGPVREEGCSGLAAAARPLNGARGQTTPCCWAREGWDKAGVSTVGLHLTSHARIGFLGQRGWLWELRVSLRRNVPPASPSCVASGSAPLITPTLDPTAPPAHIP